MDEWGPAAVRIAAARKAVGLTEPEVAEAAALSDAEYADLESYDDEAFTCISLRQLCRLAQVLTVRPEDIVAAEQGMEHEAVSPTSLVSALKARMVATQESTEGFSERVGWAVEELLSDPRRIWEWNVDGLHDLCREIGVQWLGVLAAWPAEPQQ